MSTTSPAPEVQRSPTAATPKFQTGDRVFVQALTAPGEPALPRLPGLVVGIVEHEPESYAESIGLPPFYEVTVPQPVYQLHREAELTVDDGSELTATEQVEVLRKAVAAVLEIAIAGNGRSLGVKSVRAVQSLLEKALAAPSS